MGVEEEVRFFLLHEVKEHRGELHTRCLTLCCEIYTRSVVTSHSDGQDESCESQMIVSASKLTKSLGE